MVAYNIELKKDEKEQALEHIKKQCIKSLYVFEQSEISTDYNYKDYIYNLSLFVQSADDLFNGELAKIIVNLYCILKHDFDKKTFRRIILECKNIIDYNLKLIRDVGDTNGQSN